MLFNRFSTELIRSRMSLSSFSSCSSLTPGCWLAGRKGEGRGSIGRSGSKGLFGSIVSSVKCWIDGLYVFYHCESGAVLSL